MTRPVPPSRRRLLVADTFWCAAFWLLVVAIAAVGLLLGRGGGR